MTATASPSYGVKEFSELLSPFLREKLEQARRDGDVETERVLATQYLIGPEESDYRDNEGLRHYNADCWAHFEGVQVQGVERFYRRLMVVEPVLGCAAHCRYCLRKNYDPFQNREDDLSRIARYIGEAEENAELREILVTGGDPFLSPSKLGVFLSSLAKYAAQIQVVRVATRVPLHQPSRVTPKLLGVLGADYPFRIEVGTQINHSAELFPEVVDAYAAVRERVDVIYNQGVLLAGLNDTVDELAALYDRCREMGVESHYLFHCVPIMGLSSLRLRLDDALALIRELSSSGLLSGRTKPMLTLMTDIGKLTLYEGTIIDRQESRILLQSHYDLKERRRWNPLWVLPENAEVDGEGKLRVWYEDGSQLRRDL